MRALSDWLGLAPVRERPLRRTPDTERDRPATLRDVRRLYARPPSFTNLLPWMEYDTAARVFWLEDGESCGALFELTPVGCEARPVQFLEDLREKLQHVLCDTLPEEDEAPWVLQLYLQDEPRLDELRMRLEAYLTPRAADTPFTRHYLDVLDRHLDRIAQPEGLFEDRTTGTRFRGKVRRLRAVLYRRRTWHSHSVYRLGPAEELGEVCAKFGDALAAAGVRARRCGGVDLYRWLLPWFNPAPAWTSGDPRSLLDLAPYPGDGDLPFGADFAEWLCLSRPRSESESATWWFDGLPHRVITLQGLRSLPAIGQFTAERGVGDHVLALFDQVPEGTILAMTLTFRPQDQIRKHLSRIRHAAAGDGPEAQIAREETEYAQLEIARGNELHKVDLAFYVRGADLKRLRREAHRLNALLVSHGLQPIGEEADLLALDSYLRYLPMNFEPRLDRVLRRSRLLFSRDTASLLPLYGRSTGTGNPGLLFWNRGGEPLVFDPIRDRKANAHMLILGPTGAGKSALLCYALMQMMAIYRPRVFIIEAGGSFALLGQHFAAQGLTVNQVTLRPHVDVSLPPFAEAPKLLDTVRPLEAATGIDDLEAGDGDLDDDRRDLLGEMEIAARLMITGGEAREEARMTRADRLLIREAILEAAKAVRARGRPQALTEDVARALRQMKTEFRQRAHEMASSLALFTSPGSLEAHFFNRPGQLWPEADVTIFEMGILAQEGYEDKLSIAYMGLMNHIHALVERGQYQDRPSLVLTDEAHLITTNPLLAPYLVKVSKMWRKLGTWLWLATQNLEDFPNAAKRMLNMMEWWLCLSMPVEEVESIARFKELTAEQRALLLAARKEPGKYTEGVVLGKNLSMLFRNVPPPLALALAMTEQHEKAERRAIMNARHCSELEAAYLVAERLEETG